VGTKKQVVARDRRTPDAVASAGLLAQHPLFHAWEAADLARVAAMSRVVQARRGTTLFFEGAPCEALFLLMEGRVQLYRITPDGREVALHEVGKGSVVACAALFLGKSFPANGRVVSAQAELVLVSGNTFLDLLAQRPDLSRRMIAALAMRLSELADRLEQQGTKPARQRLAAWLLDQPSTPGPGGAREVRVDGTKRDLAASLGMTPETFSRMLAQLAADGAIATRGNTIRILDLKRLQAEE